MLLATHIIEEGRGTRPKPRESRQMSRRPSPREFRDWELPAPADFWLRIGLVLAKRKYWVGNWITVGVLIFSFIPNISYWEWKTTLPPTVPKNTYPKILKWWQIIKRWAQLLIILTGGLANETSSHRFFLSLHHLPFFTRSAASLDQSCCALQTVPPSFDHVVCGCCRI